MSSFAEPFRQLPQKLEESVVEAHLVLNEAKTVAEVWRAHRPSFWRSLRERKIRWQQQWGNAKAGIEQELAQLPKGRAEVQELERLPKSWTAIQVRWHIKVLKFQVRLYSALWRMRTRIQRFRRALLDLFK